MFLLYASIALIAPYSIGCKPSKSGVFDNVTVLIKGLDKTTTEDSILIEFDDSLSKYLNNKPSEIVIIRNQFIPKLETNSVADLTKVQNLTLAGNGIREIQQGTFQNLPNLKVLNLSRNSIEEVRIGIFTDLRDARFVLGPQQDLADRLQSFQQAPLEELVLAEQQDIEVEQGLVC
jgi:hypothetical protein